MLAVWGLGLSCWNTPWSSDAGRKVQNMINVDISGNVNSENIKGGMVLLRESTAHMYASSKS